MGYNDPDICYSARLTNAILVTGWGIGRCSRCYTCSNSQIRLLYHNLDCKNARR